MNVLCCHGLVGKDVAISDCCIQSDLVRLVQYVAEIDQCYLVQSVLGYGNEFCVSYTCPIQQKSKSKNNKETKGERKNREYRGGTTHIFSEENRGPQETRMRNFCWLSAVSILAINCIKVNEAYLFCQIIYINVFQMNYINVNEACVVRQINHTRKCLSESGEFTCLPPNCLHFEELPSLVSL